MNFGYPTHCSFNHLVYISSPACTKSWWNPCPRELWKTMTAPSHPTRIGPEYSPLPLNGSFVRLLDILPGDHGSSIHCNLRVASLRSQLSYKALSYAWIDENISTSRSKGELIICNGRQVLIPSNLHSALQTFKSTTSILTLWVDFLCINQQDTQERNRQVAMMRSIYSNSSEVLIWLGPNTSGDHLGDGRTARSTTGSNSYKVVWHNDTRDEDIVRSYIELFSRYEHLGEHVMPIPWSRDVFGAFVVLNQLAKGSSMRNLRFYKAALMSSEQIRWASLVQKGISALVDSSWVRPQVSMHIIIRAV